MDSKKWIITLSGEQPIDEVKQKLVDAGFNVKDVYDEIGSISGDAPGDVATKLRLIRGVADVSENTDIQLPSPGTDTTW